MNLVTSLLVVLGCTLVGQASFAKGGSGLGLSVGLGIPFMSQAAVNYKVSDKFGFHAGYNLFSLDAGDAKVELSMPELMVHYHPFAGAFFLGAGLGQEKLDISSTDLGTGNTVALEVEATTTIFKIGWMWGIQDEGFWFGIDYAFISPSGAKETITAPGVPTTSDAYLDAQDAAKKFGETAYGNITFARFGWIF